DHIRNAGKTGKMGQELIAIVAERKGGRAYLAPSADHKKVALSAVPDWKPETELPDNPRDFKTPNYGLNTFGDLFTSRQLVALNTLCDLVAEARDQIRTDAAAERRTGIGEPLANGGSDALAYAEAVSVFFAFGISKMTDYHSTLTSW